MCKCGYQWVWPRKGGYEIVCVCENGWVKVCIDGRACVSLIGHYGFVGG